MRQTPLHRGDPVRVGKPDKPYTGKFRNRWPIHVDPDNIAQVFIRHPDTGQWHALEWEHAAHVDAPFSEEALQYARRIVLQEHGFVDDRLALDELLTRWNLHMGVSAAKQRMALRMSRQDEALSNQAETTDAAVVAGLPTVQAVTGTAGSPRSDGRQRRRYRRRTGRGLRRRQHGLGMTTDLHDVRMGHKKGWARIVNATPRVQPARLTGRKMSALSPSEKAKYDKQRRDWHANMGVLRTPQLRGLHDTLWDIVDSNLHDNDRAKGAVAIEGAAGLGKSS